MLQLVYHSLVQFFQQVFRNPKLAQFMTYHSEHRSSLGDICDFQDGSAYRDAMQEQVQGVAPVGSGGGNRFGGCSSSGSSSGCGCGCGSSSSC